MRTVAVRFLCAAVVVLLSLPLGATAQNPVRDDGQMLAMEIQMTGNGPPVDGRAYAELLTYVASLLADGRLDRYIVLGRGIEGGQYFCIQPRYSPRLTAQTVMERLDRIRPDVKTTTYSKRLVRECRTSR